MVKRKKTLYSCTPTRDVLPSSLVGRVHTCSVVSVLSHRLTWWKVWLVKNLVLYEKNNEAPSLFFGNKILIIIHKNNYLSSKFYCYCKRVAPEGRGGGIWGGFITQEERSKQDTQEKHRKWSGSGVGLGLGPRGNYNRANSTLILPGPLCGQRSRWCVQGCQNLQSRQEGQTVITPNHFDIFTRHSLCTLFFH